MIFFPHLSEVELRKSSAPKVTSWCFELHCEMIAVIKSIIISTAFLTYFAPPPFEVAVMHRINSQQISSMHQYHSRCELISPLAWGSCWLHHKELTQRVSSVFIPWKGSVVSLCVNMVARCRDAGNRLEDGIGCLRDTHWNGPVGPQLPSHPLLMRQTHIHSGLNRCLCFLS